MIIIINNIMIINYTNAYLDTYVNKSTIVFFELNIFKVILSCYV